MPFLGPNGNFWISPSCIPGLRFRGAPAPRHNKAQAYTHTPPFPLFRPEFGSDKNKTLV
jgi:hypothetical protein